MSVQQPFAKSPKSRLITFWVIIQWVCHTWSDTATIIHSEFTTVDLLYHLSRIIPNPLLARKAQCTSIRGPGEDDVYEDDRADFRKSEPTTYINAPFVGVLAYFVANPSPN
ncbi:putative cellulase [Rosa chinensis]|uniref:Endoglucanase n=1 Tax=Rosa chinensis TaxID=74649 RepID=A0A2P6PQ06_ROSCH|nr:putative cellulase [Rosa chinensis]